MEQETKEKKGLIAWVMNYLRTHKTQAEILRFIIVGGIATLIDFFITGVILYIFDPNLYPHFYNVFFGGGKPKTIATVISTGVGFTVSLIVNYILSVVFVFSDKGNSKTKTGFLLFVFLSLIGLGINMLGMYLGYDLCHINEWIVKIVMTIVVLVYNYISRKLFIFKKDNKENQQEDNEEPTKQEETVAEEITIEKENTVEKKDTEKKVKRVRTNKNKK